MTDGQLAAYEAKCAAAAKLNAEILPHNKQVLFDQLASAGISTVTIDFNGYGDSGSFQETTAFDANDAEIPLPITDITIKTVMFDNGAVEEQVTKVRDYLEHLASEFLDQTHSGWEDGEGAYGEFRFGVADQSITLEYSERYTETNYHEHMF